MSPLVFKTPSSHPTDVEIAHVGTVGAQGRGGIPVERAAEVMAELQDDSGKPLSGKRLEDAAQAFAEARGLSLSSLKRVDEERLRVEAGALPRGKTIEEISAEASERDFGQVEEHAENPEASPLVTEDLPPADQIGPDAPPALPAQGGR